MRLCVICFSFGFRSPPHYSVLYLISFLAIALRDHGICMLKSEMRGGDNQGTSSAKSPYPPSFFSTFVRAHDRAPPTKKLDKSLDIFVTEIFRKPLVSAPCVIIVILIFSGDGYLQILRSLIAQITDWSPKITQSAN